MVRQFRFLVSAILMIQGPSAFADPGYEDALALRSSRGFAMALEMAQSELSANPNDGRAWAVAALVYGYGVDFLGMDPAEARQEMDRALKEAMRLRPDGPYARAAYGLIRRTTDPEGAEQRLRECIADRPDFLECQNLYADTLRKAGRFEEAERAYGRALEQWPTDGELLVSYALQLQETGRVREGLEILRSLAATQPAFPRGHWHLAAMLYETGGDVTEAQRSAVRDLELDPLIWNGERLLNLLEEAAR